LSKRNASENGFQHHFEWWSLLDTELYQANRRFGLPANFKNSRHGGNFVNQRLATSATADPKFNAADSRSLSRP
jgi:hypothetical protein